MRMKSRKGRRPYRASTVVGKTRVDKAKLDHALEKLKERTELNPKVLYELRKSLKKSDIPPGTHYVPLSEGGFAVVKDVGKTKKKHIVATILSAEMTPPGMDVSSSLKKVSSAELESMLNFLRQVERE
jgi:hypothetical protein